MKLKRMFIPLLVLTSILVGCAKPMPLPTNPEGDFQKETISQENLEAGSLLMEVIDVGQGDAILIKTPSGKSMLIDAGDRGSFEIIKERLDHHQVESIDVLVATHPHADHIGSMEEVVRNYAIGEIYMPDVVHSSKTFENLLLTIEERNYEITLGASGEVIHLDPSLNIKILSPVKTPQNLNDASIVMMITFGEVRYLLTGDIEETMEKMLEGSLEAEVLKVAHHGSSTSSSEDFLKRVNPKYAIISVGEGNRYNHPSPSILHRLQSMDVNVYRTDESGHITVTTDGKDIEISSSLQNYPKEDTLQRHPSKETVFATKTGSRYHKEDCIHLSASKISLSLEKALEKGLEPCGTCKP